jgi:hypothetical protein
MNKLPSEDQNTEAGCLKFIESKVVYDSKGALSLFTYKIFISYMCIVYVRWL